MVALICRVSVFVVFCVSSLLFSVVACCVMLCHVVLCCVMLCYVVLCCVIYVLCYVVIYMGCYIYICFVIWVKNKFFLGAPSGARRGGSPLEGGGWGVACPLARHLARLRAQMPAVLAEVQG